jgi:hypothetical protein
MKFTLADRIGALASDVDSSKTAMGVNEGLLEELGRVVYENGGLIAKSVRVAPRVPALERRIARLEMVLRAHPERIAGMKKYRQWLQAKADVLLEPIE